MWLKKNLNLLVIIGACIIVFTFFNKKEDYVGEYNAKIEALEQNPSLTYAVLQSKHNSKWVD